MNSRPVWFERSIRQRLREPLALFSLLSCYCLVPGESVSFPPCAHTCSSFLAVQRKSHKDAVKTLLPWSRNACSCWGTAPTGCSSTPAWKNDKRPSEKDKENLTWSLQERLTGAMISCWSTWSQTKRIVVWRLCSPKLVSWLSGSCAARHKQPSPPPTVICDCSFFFNF